MIFLRSIPSAVRQVLEPLEALGTDMATLANATEDEHDLSDPNVVKAVVSFDPARPELGRALYFTRATAPTGPGPVWHHIGIYAFTPRALERFAALPPSPLEQRERLEQLRALEHGMSIGVRLVDAVPFGVDTPADLEKARRLLEAGRERDGRSPPIRSARSRFRACPAPTRTWPAAKPSPSWTPCPATRSRTRSRPCARGRPAMP